MKSETYKLCDACARLMADAFSVCRVGGGCVCKLACDHCGKTAYGGVYQVEAKKKGKEESDADDDGP